MILSPTMTIVSRHGAGGVGCDPYIHSVCHSRSTRFRTLPLIADAYAGEARPVTCRAFKGWSETLDSGMVFVRLHRAPTAQLGQGHVIRSLLASAPQRSVPWAKAVYIYIEGL